MVEDDKCTPLMTNPLTQVNCADSLASLLRSPDGTNWSQVGAFGFGDPSNGAFNPSVVFAGQLYLGTSRSSGGGQVWRSPDGTNWTQVVFDGFGDLDNVAVSPTVVLRYGVRSRPSSPTSIEE